MTSRVKEDERIEKIIRGLLKLPENKRCINCNSLGPQYVCTTFWTFVCTTCSGVHREFTHRVKSVSMAKFTAEEVSALQAGGNERARQIYLKAWDPQRHSFPDASNLHKLREYIKHVYVDRKYAGQRNTDSLPPVKLNKQNENYDRKTSADTYGRHSYEKPGSSGRPDLKYYHDEWRSSPRYARENSRSGGFKRSPIQFEVVDDRFRDDENTRGRKSDPRRTASVEVMARSRSPVPQKIVNRSMSPVIRPVADLLGENVPHLQVGGPSKGNKEKNADASPIRQDPSSDVGGSITDGQAPEDKRQESTSLVDFYMDPNPPSSETTAEKQTKRSAQFTSVNTSAIAEIPRDQSLTTLESLLFELNAPANAVSANEQQGDNKDDTSTVPPGNTSAPAGETKPARGASESAATEVTNGQQSDVTSENQPAPSSSFESNSIAPQYGSYVDIDNNQSNTSLEQSIQAVSLGAHDRSSISAPNTPVEASTTWRYEPPTRKELPADLFSLSYPPVAVPAAGWQTGQPHALGFGIHYHPTAYQTGGFPNSAGSTNPFDLSDDDGSRPDQREMFPSMASVQGALSSFPVSAGFLNTPIPGTQLTSYSLYSSAVTVTGADTGHQPPADPPTGPQGLGAASISNAFDFGSLGSAQPTNRSSAPIAQHSLPSTKSNPFE
uniref:Arf-GAP domain-containing protein n=1 Tax=Kalanchoe fedtschenkoi TaxID=63787 RepID=A0A7N0TQ40_KALFE